MPAALKRSILTRPHPRLRKAIKWGGLAIVLVLVATWVGSHQTWFHVERGGVHFDDALDICGGVVAARHVPQEFSSGIASGWHVETFPAAYSPSFKGSRWYPDVQLTFLDGWLFTIPLWIPTAIFALITAAAWRLDVLARRRSHAGLCPQCGYSREGLPGADFPCPECGHAQTVATAR